MFVFTQQENMMNLNRLRLGCLVLFIMIAAVLSSSAQTSKGIIAGIVRDQSGAVIPKANVTVTSEETGETRNVIGDDLGAFRVDAVGVGHYTINVQAQGFGTANVHALNVTPSVVT